MTAEQQLPLQFPSLTSFFSLLCLVPERRVGYATPPQGGPAKGAFSLRRLNPQRSIMWQCLDQTNNVGKNRLMNKKKMQMNPTFCVRKRIALKKVSFRLLTVFCYGYHLHIFSYALKPVGDKFGQQS